MAEPGGSGESRDRPEPPPGTESGAEPPSGARDAPFTGSDPEAGAEGGSDMELLRRLLARTLGLGAAEDAEPERRLEELTLRGVGRFLSGGRCKKVLCMVGAGISTSAGIPDFRSPGTGLYANLGSYDLPYPEAIFEISFFKEHPEPFFTLARELFPGQFKPTVCHYFMRLLQNKGLLLRCYTQNIDALERVAGLEPERVVEAHGTFVTSHCLEPSCRQRYDLRWMKERIFSSLVPRCEKCGSVVKPDIVFFGENLPSRFFSLLQADFPQADLLLIMGTSLQVQPFASLVGRVPPSTPRLLINKEKTGQGDPLLSLMGLGSGMDFDSEKAYRDVAWLGECDEGCRALAELLGWKDELEALVRSGHAAIDAETGGDAGDPSSVKKEGGISRGSSPAKKEGEQQQGDPPSIKRGGTP